VPKDRDGCEGGRNGNKNIKNLFQSHNGNVDSVFRRSSRRPFPGRRFYKGKVINYIVSTKPGGGYDAYARIIGKYMQKYIPGVTVIVKNIPGAGNIIGANEIYLAKPNGLTIGTSIRAYLFPDCWFPGDQV